MDEKGVLYRFSDVGIDIDFPSVSWEVGRDVHFSGKKESRTWRETVEWLTICPTKHETGVPLMSGQTTPGRDLS